MRYAEALKTLCANDPRRARDSYIDGDLVGSAKRFESSEEFAAVLDVLKKYGNGKGQTVLDLGAGTGIAAYAFARKGCRVIAVEPMMSEDFGALAIARISTKERVEIDIVSAYAEQLPFRNFCFDLIYMRQALHHAQSLTGMLTECARVLRKGGLLFATREHVVSNERQLHEFLENNPIHKLYPCENAYRVSQYKSAFRQSNLKVIRVWRQFDSMINLNPIEEGELTNKQASKLASVFGVKLSRFLIQKQTVNMLIRGYLNIRHRDPGRLFSFLAVKEN